jgi:hypothetical protein
MRTRARYSVVKTEGKTVWITDDDGPVSVTNDAEAVCRNLNALVPGCRIIYRDSMSNWDELKHDYGIFTGFAPARDMDPSIEGGQW